MEKKNNLLVVLVIILCILVLGLSGYIVYDKLFNNDINDSELKNDNNKELNVNNNNINGDLIEITLTEKEKEEINLELNKVFEPNASMGFFNNLFSDNNIDLYKNNYFDDDCNKLNFSYYYLVRVDSSLLENNLISYYDENIKENSKKFKFSSLINVTKKIFNVDKIDSNNCNNDIHLNEEDYIVFPYARGGWAPYTLSVDKKYKDKNGIYVLEIKVLELIDGDGGSKEINNIKLTYGIDNNDKYLIGFNYFK